jgi:hypothetical protein
VASCSEHGDESVGSIRCLNLLSIQGTVSLKGKTVSHGVVWLVY